MRPVDDEKRVAPGDERRVDKIALRHVKSGTIAVEQDRDVDCPKPLRGRNDEQAEAMLDYQFGHPFHVRDMEFAIGVHQLRRLERRSPRRSRRLDLAAADAAFFLPSAVSPKRTSSSGRSPCSGSKPSDAMVDAKWSGSSAVTSIRPPSG